MLYDVENIILDDNQGKLWIGIKISTINKNRIYNIYYKIVYTDCNFRNGLKIIKNKKIGIIWILDTMEKMFKENKL